MEEKLTCSETGRGFTRRTCAPNGQANPSGVEVLSYLDLEATPPYEYAHEDFGYRDRLSQPVVEGTGEVPTPGSGAPLKPGEFLLGYPDEERTTQWYTWPMKMWRPIPGGPAKNFPVRPNGSFGSFSHSVECE